MKKSDPEDQILPPIDFDPPSNGEFCPLPPTALARKRHELWRRLVEDKHRRLGMSRRTFAESACGTAAWLFVYSQVPACGGGGTGGGGPADAGVAGTDVAGFDVPPEAMEDMALARELLRHDPFVFDVQTHISTDEISPWPERDPPQIVLDFLKRTFVQSNTTVACLSGVPSGRDLGLANVQARSILRELIDRVAGPRLLFHCNAVPGMPGEPDFMSEALSLYKHLAAWKTFPLTPGRGLDHPDCAPFLEQARRTGVKVVCTHRGLNGNGNYAAPGSPVDVVRAARSNPDIQFLVYHSGWESANDENHAYADNGIDTMGVDRFIKALRENDIGPTGNVYAELGSTWANVMGNALAAGHVLGKLLAQLGPDRIVWGTDTVFTGNAQPQIDALWMFSIPPAIEAMYPPLTTEVKRKILGLNGAAVYGVDPTAVRHAIKDDDIDRLRMAYLDDPRSIPMPGPRDYVGPRTRREFLAFLRHQRQG